MQKPSRAALVAAAAAIAPFAAACENAAAEPTARVEYSDAFSTRTPGVASGRLFHDEFFDAHDASAKPPAVQHVHEQLPAGARYDTGAVPACGATDAQLMAQGASACAPGSQVGTEVYSFDTGVDGPNRIVTSDITFLNDPGQLIILTQERQSGTRVVVRGQLTRDSLDFELPPLPGTPPDGGADKREDSTFPVTRGPAGKAWLTTPPTCPASGIWTFRVDYTFRNGEKVTRTSGSPCDRATSRATVPRVTFFHRQHGRTMRVRASAATPARLTIERNGRRVADRRVQLKAGINRLRLPALPPGSYRLVLKPAAGTARRATLVIS
jgi:hypothetical protein